MGLQEIEFNAKDYEKYIYDIVWSVKNKFGTNPRWDFDDLVSEAWIAFFESKKSFNPEYSTSLTAYARPYVYKRLLEFLAVNMYTFKVRYYNIRDDKEKLDALNNIENGILTNSSASNHSENTNGGIAPYELAPSGLCVQTEIANQEELNLVRNIVSTNLTKKQQRAIKLRFDDELSYREIGDKLGCSSESARSLIAKSLEKLKYRIKDAGINGTNN